MRQFTLFLIFIVGLASPVWANDYKREPGSFAVSTQLGEWTDSARSRSVPYKIYYPKEADGERPVVIFSHGLGGSREGSEYLGQHLASYGYIGVHIQHPGSDESLWRGKEKPLEALRDFFKDPANMIEQSRLRFEDLPFALDSISELNESDATLKGRFDLARIGMSGHSFGAHSTMAASGQVYGTPARALSYGDARIKASIAYSPSPPLRRTDYDVVYGKIAVPIFHMTGTDDGDPVNARMSPEDRTTPYKQISATDQFLLVLAGGDHMIFSGRRTRGVAPKPSDPRHLDIIRMGSIAFWDAYLLDDSAARKWLTKGGFAEAVGKDGTFEQKVK
jgi:dienelactone hydrolase